MLLPTLILAAALVAPAVQPGDKLNAPQRQEAIERLESEADSDAEAKRSMATRVADFLGDGWRSAEKLRLVADLPESEVGEGYRAMLDRLRFQPIIEANTPPDWPAPTVVGEIELKRYPAHRLARTTGGDGGVRDSGMFFQLFNHIQAKDIPMTTPVEMTGRAAGLSGDAATMAFLYPDGKTGEPGAAGGAVEVLDIPADTYVSLGVRGNLPRDRATAAEQILRDWLTAHPSFEATGPARTLGWNSPMVLGAMRYSEVQIPVRTQ